MPYTIQHADFIVQATYEIQNYIQHTRIYSSLLARAGTLLKLLYPSGSSPLSLTIVLTNDITHCTSSSKSNNITHLYVKRQTDDL